MPKDNEGQGPKQFNIQIDRAHYVVTEQHLTGSQLRSVPPTAIPNDRDLFEVVPGQADKKIADSDLVELRNGKRFFTAPAHINPGAEQEGSELRDGAS